MLSEFRRNRRESACKKSLATISTERLSRVTSVYEVLSGLRVSARSEVDKGSRFERLVRAFLVTDPVYAGQFKDVWLWGEWPGNGGRHDAGIDLVAQDRLTEGYVAIQCKFYSPGSIVSKADIDSFLSESGKEGFVERVVVSTTDKWNTFAENAIKGQQIPVRRIGLSDLEASPIDWARFDIEAPEVLTTVGRKALRPHQVVAVDSAAAGFVEHDRGKLIMACGTGKTFTSLRLAEQVVGPGGSALFLVPSISLLSQTLREWSVEAEIPLSPLAVCSDRKSTARSRNENEDIATVDLALPATTDIKVLTERLRRATAEPGAMTVVFSTYQSIDVVARAQAESGIQPFDLIICDEAHRTTGVTLVDEDESPFVRVHDADYVKGTKRLYMTATPRIYDESTKAKAGDADAVLVSMDDEAVYGPEFHRLGFGEAVARDLLTDYKVLVLAVDNKMVASTFQAQLADESGELQLDDVAKIVGCWNGLAKRGQAEHDFGADPEPMRRAVAFAGTIKASKKVEGMFESIVDRYVEVHETDDAGRRNGLDCEVKHVDGTFNALERNAKLDWLRAEVPDGACHVLANARCLSEGVDVPALDAVMFLSPRKSVVDVVQSVGRVMRKAPGKKYGYIILPIAIPEGVTPETALRDNTRYQVVWEVLQALRAHDERLNAEINKIDLTKKRSDRINVIGVGGGARARNGEGVQQALTLSLRQLDEWRDAVYARIVTKVGSRRYWEDWAKSVARIAEAHITRITGLLDTNHAGAADAFEKFLDGLRANLNDGITRANAVEMLAQHLITRPVFDALFGGYDFAAHNPVARAMEQMLATLDEHNLESENADLVKFYESVRTRVQGIDTAEGRQRIIVELYDTFFSTAFKRTVDKLGIVYTPIEIVDFILRSADDVLRAEFDQGLTDENVHVLDGFTGTGTFVTRLIQSGLIEAADLPRKYQSELHANEILLLAYYIAAVNIETTYLDAVNGHLDSADYKPFPGLILTDTFQSWEDGAQLDFEVLRENNERLERLKRLPITVIVGNPPYSVGQESANDDNANEAYPELDQAIRDTYAARAAKSSIRGLYDSYVRAIKWATLRIRERGVIAYVTNGGFLDSASADGMRKALTDEFSSIHIFNLRGNRRNAGAEGRPVFEAYAKGAGGSIAGIAIVVLVKNPAATGGCRIHYAEVGDFTTAQEKLQEVVDAGSILRADSRRIIPNAQGDWLRQRRDDFAAFLPLWEKGTDGVFALSSKGLTTNRDSWVYNFSRSTLADNVQRVIRTYTEAKGSPTPTKDPRLISWSRRLIARHDQGRDLAHDDTAYRLAIYRPFQRQHVYFSADLNEDRRRLPLVFPSDDLPNKGFLLTGVASHYDFSVIATDTIPDLHLLDTGQFFPRWTYESKAPSASNWEAVTSSTGTDVSTTSRITRSRCSALLTVRTSPRTTSSTTPTGCCTHPSTAKPTPPT
ncbi:DEAD/DEAH box helicase [Saccharothrix yanglingensis]|uniref:DEAD/DEAH box helicase n=1 Tax=Saccharothrix yanglingensis TaxID=659496 RepID=UPI0027D2F67E|nr:type ISP restriction/modification enzyme [Saccharothrix yanglingensis]